MHFIAHVVGFEGFKDGGFDRFTRGDIRKGQGFGRVEEAVEVRVELEDFTVVHAQASHTASPPWTALSKTDILASSRGSSSPPMWMRMFSFRGSGNWIDTGTPFTQL